jgi:ATP adenylyltransferase
MHHAIADRPPPRYAAQMSENASLYAPWRMDYIRSLQKPAPDECFLCTAAASQNDEQRKERLVLWQTEQTIVLMNRYPYANGHLLVAPRQHLPDLELLTEAQKLDLVEQTTQAVRLLKRAVSAQGFNIGINLGRCAGAGVPGHLHQHVVPRWAGDVNFMHVVGEVSIIPEANSRLYAELIRTLKSFGSPAHDPSVSDAPQ